MVHSDVLDASLQYIIDNCDEIHFCSQDPTTYTEAAVTYTLGSKATPAFNAITTVGSDRRLTVTPFLDGAATGTGTVTHVAFVDTGASKLLKTQAQTVSFPVTSGVPIASVTNTITIGEV